MQTIQKEYPVARFEVTENFAGAQSAEFEVSMTSDFFIGAIPQQVPAFREGEVWLVEAYYDQSRAKMDDQYVPAHSVG